MTLMNKNLLLGSAVLAGVAAVHPAAAKSKASAKNQMPNVVFILADDLGYGELSCYGQEKYQILNIDPLAVSGQRFTHT